MREETPFTSAIPITYGELSCACTRNEVTFIFGSCLLDYKQNPWPTTYESIIQLNYKYLDRL